jgi:hypothetical protein
MFQFAREATRLVPVNREFSYIVGRLSHIGTRLERGNTKFAPVDR